MKITQIFNKPGYGIDCKETQDFSNNEIEFYHNGKFVNLIKE